jgi:hypothetical protein
LKDKYVVINETNLQEFQNKLNRLYIEGYKLHTAYMVPAFDRGGGL